MASKPDARRDREPEPVDRFPERRDQRAGHVGQLRLEGEQLEATKMGRDWIVTRRALRDYLNDRAPQGRRAKRERG